MEVRLNASHGLLFYAGGGRDGSSLALYVAKARFILLLNHRGKMLRLRSKDKYNDGRWHTVFFGREKNKMRLVIDGLRAQNSVLQSGAPFSLTHPIYIGGVPALKGNANIPAASLSSLSGCLRTLRLDGKPLGSPDGVFGVTSCYEGPTEPGFFFSADGGFLRLDTYPAYNTCTSHSPDTVFSEDLVEVGQDLELKLELRPLRPAGLLFHMGTEGGHYVTLSMADEKVTVTVNVGAGEYATSVTAQRPLCDGQWHTITVTKVHNVIQLDLDTEGNHTVGANSPVSLRGRETLYVGGVPESTRVAGYTSSPSSFYVGCMRNLVVNRNVVDVSKSGTFTGSAGTNLCPAP
ncbi:hypothetical protein FKM82_007583 [Ascaphus truei]